MTTRLWEIEIKGTAHTVQLQHAVFSGKREIQVDGQQILRARNFIDYGSQNPFSIEGVPCELGITTNGITYDYYLLVDGKRINTVGRKDRSLARATRKAIAEVEYWQKLATLSGLKHLPASSINTLSHHRLIGSTQGYLTVVRIGVLRNTALTVINILLRVSPIMDLESTRESIKREFRELQKQDKTLRNDSLDVRRDYVAVSMLYKPLKESPETTSSRIKQIVSIFSKHVRPLSTDLCEGTECRSRIGQDLQLAFINGFPTYLCKDCINQIPALAQKSLDEYKKAPSGLLKGLLAGFVAATAGGLAWAIVAYFLNTIAAVIAALILLLVIKAMDKVGTKRTIWSILSGSFLAVGGIILGVFITYVIYGFTHHPEQSLLEVFERSWRALLKGGEFFEQSIIVFGLLGILPYLWLLWSSHKKQMSQAAKPHIEIIEEWSLR